MLPIPLNIRNAACTSDITTGMCEAVKSSSMPDRRSVMPNGSGLSIDRSGTGRKFLGP